MRLFKGGTQWIACAARVHNDTQRYLEEQHIHRMAWRHRAMILLVRLLLSVCCLAGIALLAGAALAIAVPSTVNPAVTTFQRWNMLILSVAVIVILLALDKVLTRHVETWKNRNGKNRDGEIGDR